VAHRKGKGIRFEWNALEVSFVCEVDHRYGVTTGNGSNPAWLLKKECLACCAAVAAILRAAII